MAAGDDPAMICAKAFASPNMNGPPSTSTVTLCVVLSHGTEMMPSPSVATVVPASAWSTITSMIASPADQGEHSAFTVTWSVVGATSTTASWTAIDGAG